MHTDLQAVLNEWDELCSALGPWESQHLAKDDSASALMQHFSRVNDLLSGGRLLQRAIVHPEFADKSRAARIEARIRHLEDKMALWHREMAPAEQNRILAIFD
jgi:hypothetical protein